MTSITDWWVVTDLDGTLLDHNYDIQPALGTLQWLKEIGVPVIPCTSKTEAEVNHFRSKYGFKDPYIVENGGAIYGDNTNGGSWELPLGLSYKELRPILDHISRKIDYRLISFKDLNPIEVHELTGLKNESIKLAQQRLWSVPFLTPPSEYILKIEESANGFGTMVLRGNLMSHLISNNTNKGTALRHLKKYLKVPNVKVLALGDSPNDMHLLQAADCSIVVPGKNGINPFFREHVTQGKFLSAKESHAKGWACSVKRFFTEMYQEF